MRRPRSDGFSLIELLVVIAIIALLISILLPALGEARRAGRQAVCMANLQQMSRAHHTYATDFRDFIAAFNGRAEDKATAGHYRAAVFPLLYDCSAQAMSIIQERDPDNAKNIYAFGPDSGIGIPFIFDRFSHLVLANYLAPSGGALFPSVVCPEDRPLLSWRANVNSPKSSAYVPVQTQNANNFSHFPYATSYRLLPAAWILDKPPGVGDIGVAQGAFHDQYDYYMLHKTSPDPLGRRKITDVAAPANKVALADSHQRHMGKQELFFAFPDARQPLLFWDSSVSLRVTKDCNKGWDRRDYYNPGSVKINYYPDRGFEASVPTGRNPNIKDAGCYKWTRYGLRGIDYGGREVFPR